MKPSISIDERGVILHVTDSEGHGIAVPLDADTIGELVSKLAVARANVQTSEGRKRLVKGLAQLVVALTEPLENKEDG